MNQALLLLFHRLQRVKPSMAPKMVQAPDTINTTGVSRKSDDAKVMRCRRNVPNMRLPEATFTTPEVNRVMLVANVILESPELLLNSVHKSCMIYGSVLGDPYSTNHNYVLMIVHDCHCSIYCHILLLV